MMPFNFALPRLLLPLAALLLGACSLLPEARPVDIYRLPPSSLAASTQAPLALSLSLARPAASQALNSARIAVLAGDNRLSSYAGARWSSPAPALLRDHLLDALQREGRWRALSSDESALQADLLLDGDLRAFQVELQQGVPVAHIQLDLRLADGASQRLLAGRRFEARQALAQDDPQSAVMALGTAADRLAAEVARWLAEQVQAR